MTNQRILSFKYAFSGIWTALKDEPNLKFHFLAALGVVILAWYFGLSKAEWLVILLTIGIVISLELTNAAIEEVVDSLVNTEHPSAKIAKDVAAGAVLVSAITAVVVGLLIFLPHLMRP